MAYDSEVCSEVSTGSSDFDQVPKQPAIIEEPMFDDGPSPRSSSDEEQSSNDGITDPSLLSARAYQLEMLDASLKGNIICAMDTGLGKTQV